LSKIISQNDYDSKHITDSIRYFFERFHLSDVHKASNTKKSKGVSPLQIMSYAFALVFRNISMYMDMVLGNNELSFAKDTYYRFMKSISINWIHFTTLLAANICREGIVPATSDDRINALIIDDSTYSRGCSKKVEMLAKYMTTQRMFICIALECLPLDGLMEIHFFRLIMSCFHQQPNVRSMTVIPSTAEAMVTNVAN
jgi:hypothetical protein